MNQELQDALAFYKSAPREWLSSGEEKVKAGGTWLWEVLQGDFHEAPSTAQTVTGTVISMIPVVDQICDIRDFIANCRKIDEDSSDTWAWVALALTLIGVFPVFGSLFKGCIKVMINASRRRFHQRYKDLARDQSIFDPAIQRIATFVNYPAVRKTIETMKIHNIYQWLADHTVALRNHVSVASLQEAFQTLTAASRKVLDAVVKWGPDSLKAPVQAVWEVIERVAMILPNAIQKALSPVQNYLDGLANRLRVEADTMYRARPGNNVHVLGYDNRPGAELQLFKQGKPDWVDKVEDAAKSKNAALNKLRSKDIRKIGENWPDIGELSEQRGLKGAFKTFDMSLRAVEVAPGERLYRVVDPGSAEDRICWMREAEFKKLSSKSDWRRNYAVWKAWNENGEYAIYTIPPGKPLKAWEGRAATQKLEADSTYQLEGGWEQIVLNPKDLDPRFLSARKSTGWGYNDGTGITELDPPKPYLGLPELTNKWSAFEKKRES